MFRFVACFILLFSSLGRACAQSDSSHLRISLITCGPGNNEVYEVFGHTAVRVVDSINQTDNVYNYGEFSYGPNFEIEFMRGKLLYNLGVSSYRSFIPEYVTSHRSVQEQELIISGPQKEEIYNYLEWNYLPEHRYYKYDFFFDNCATRIRDIFPKSLNPGFKFGQTMPAGSHLTFRDIMNRYFYCRAWERVGCNILLGSRIDKVMSNEDIMFLPDYLRDGVGGATVNGQKIAAPAITILPGIKPPAQFNWPLVVTSILAFLTIIGLVFHPLARLGRFMSSFLLIITGLLGCLCLVMWFGTDHQGCSDNYNVLWLLPTNIILAFSRARSKSRYAVLAMILIFISLLLHLLKVQALIVEFLPLMLALLFIFGTIYRRSNQTPQ
jgi:hypothetical protein